MSNVQIGDKVLVTMLDGKRVSHKGEVIDLLDNTFVYMAEDGVVRGCFLDRKEFDIYNIIEEEENV